MTPEQMIAKLALVSGLLDYGRPADLRGMVEDVLGALRAAPPPPTEPRINTPCPSCGSRTLFIGEGGHLTCSLIGCTQPGVERAIAALRAALSSPVSNTPARKWTGPGELERTGYIDPGCGVPYPSARAEEP